MLWSVLQNEFICSTLLLCLSCIVPLCFGFEVMQAGHINENLAAALSQNTIYLIKNKSMKCCNKFLRC